MAMNTTKMTFRKCIVMALTACAVSVPVSADDPVSSNVRYSREIVRILERRCNTCHRSTGMAVPFDTYRQVRDWGRAIREEVVEQRMPPVSAAPGFGKFRSALAMTQRETQTLLSWLDGGMPRGNDRDLPAAEPSHEPAAAMLARIALPPQVIERGSAPMLRRVTVTLDDRVPAATARIDVRSQLPGAFKGAMVFAGPAGDHWIGGGIAGQPAVAPPQATTISLKRGDVITVLLFYLGSAQPMRDTPELLLTPGADGARGFGLVIDPRTNRRTLDRAVTLWAMQIVPADTVRTLEVRARHADGATELLAWLPRVSADWPIVLGSDEPVRLPRGATIIVAAKDAANAPAPARVSFSATIESRPLP